ncbi:hypothetical protein AARAC_010289, partial [Aspergillus arachidicola]
MTIALLAMSGDNLHPMLRDIRQHEQRDLDDVLHIYIFYFSNIDIKLYFHNYNTIYLIADHVNDSTSRTIKTRPLGIPDRRDSRRRKKDGDVVQEVPDVQGPVSGADKPVVEEDGGKEVPMLEGSMRQEMDAQGRR